ncbi:MAG: GrpB family protein [Gemmatimonadota bacterium]|nr:GrpB family protein [Gemmatimonadota bacterium]
MSLGLESGKVRVVSYDPAWPELFEIESERLQGVFADARLSLVLEHTGSTAVPGLAAKPILDILAGYPKGAKIDTYVEALVAAGYVHRGEQEIPGREFFRRGNPRAYHVHLVEIGSPFWQDHLVFRDRLRADSSLRDAYADLKRDLAWRYATDREAYITAKGPFVQQVLALPLRQ